MLALGAFCGLGRTIDRLSPLTACTTPSDTMNTSSQGGSFQVGFSSIPPSPVSKLSIIFSKRDLPSNSGKQPKATAIAYIVGHGLLDSPDQQLEKKLLMSPINNLLDNLWLLGKGTSYCME